MGATRRPAAGSSVAGVRNPGAIADGDGGYPELRSPGRRYPVEPEPASRAVVSDDAAKFG